eukprot:scaffold998_cov411-Prasinococcus_capsulatus_cf.AAC.2
MPPPSCPSGELRHELKSLEKSCCRLQQHTGWKQVKASSSEGVYKKKTTTRFSEPPPPPRKLSDLP